MIKKLINDIKIVWKELGDYKKNHHDKFFTLKRIIQMIIETSKGHWVLWVLMISILFVLFNPLNLPFISYNTKQLIIFIFLSIFSLNLITEFYIQAREHYSKHLTDSYYSFVRLLKIFTLLLMVITVILIGNSQVYYTDNWKNPKLSTCSYYDWYGNDLISISGYKKCPVLKPIEIRENTSIKFGIIYNEVLKYAKYGEENNLYYQEYEYTYEDSKIASIVEKNYYLSPEEIKSFNVNDTQPTEIKTITNEYLDDEFISIRTYQNTKIETIRSKLMENGDVLVTKESLDSEPVEIFKLDIKKYPFMPMYPNHYYEYYSQRIPYQKSHVIVEAYSNPYGTRVSLYQIQYTLNDFSNYELYSLNYISLIEQTHYFITDGDTIIHYLPRDKYFSKLKDDDIIAKSKVIKTEYGYRIDHYTNQQNIETYYGDQGCYGDNVVYFKNNYHYEIMVDSKIYGNTCTIPPFFHTANPLFLDHITNYSKM